MRQLEHHISTWEGSKDQTSEFKEGAAYAYDYWFRQVPQRYLDSWGTSDWNKIEALIALAHDDKFVAEIYNATEGHSKEFFDGAVWGSRNFVFEPLTDETLDKWDRVVIVAGYNCKVA